MYPLNIECALSAIKYSRLAPQNKGAILSKYNMFAGTEEKKNQQWLEKGGVN